jgi:hypothetical protein
LVGHENRSFHPSGCSQRPASGLTGHGAQLLRLGEAVALLELAELEPDVEADGRAATD